MSVQNLTKEIWPNFFIVGAPKAGTTSLYAYLNKIPDIYMSPVKEPAYFSRLEGHSKTYRDKEKYLSLFTKVKNQKIIGESTPSYLMQPLTPKLIHEVSPNARILISLRDPVERIFSHFLMQTRFRIPQFSFHDKLQLELKGKNSSGTNMGLHYGLYSESVKRYLDIFGNEQVKIVIFEEFIKNPKNTVQEILRFLDLNFELENFKGEVYNPFRTPRGPLSHYLLTNLNVKKLAEKLITSSGRTYLSEHFLLQKSSKPKMNQNDKDALIKFYSDDVKKLEQLLGRQLHWANFFF